MSEFEDRINSILGNPAEMEKIMSLASQFMGGGSGKNEETQTQRDGGDSQSGSGTGAGPDSGGIGGLGGFDAETLTKIGRLMSHAQGSSEKTELLRAMSPYLKPERREKMEKAIRFARVAKIARAALREYGGDGSV